MYSEEGVGVLGSPEEGVGEAGGSSESEFSNERSSTSALRPRMDNGSGARLDEERWFPAIILFYITLNHDVARNSAKDGRSV